MDKSKQRFASFMVLIRNISQGALPRMIIGATIYVLIGFSACASFVWAFESHQRERSATCISPNRYFSVIPPAGWEQSEKGILEERHNHLRFYAPDLVYPNHVYIEIACDVRRHKTAKRFIHDQREAGRSRTEGDPLDIQNVAVAGRTAQTFTKKISRSPAAGLSGEKIEGVEKSVVVPRREGFCVLTLSVPSDSFTKYVPVFDKVLASFRFNAEGKLPKTDQIPDEEYQVYSDFFHIRKTPDLTSPVSDLFPSQEKLVYELTSTAKKMTAAELKNIKASLGKEGGAIIEDYRRKNARAFLLKDIIMADGIEIFTEQDMSEATREGLKGFSEALTKKYPLRGELVYVSRVGFNKNRDTAFFHAAIANRFMGAGYYIVMQKKEAAWRLENSFLENFWYE